MKQCPHSGTQDMKHSRKPSSVALSALKAGRTHKPKPIVVQAITSLMAIVPELVHLARIIHGGVGFWEVSGD